MAHDKHTLHVSHYKGSPNYRASVAPEDRSWILLIDANGSPELYCDIPTMGENGEWVHSYEPAGDKITAITRAMGLEDPKSTVECGEEAPCTT